MCDCEEIQEIKWSKRFPSHLVGTCWQTTDKKIIDLDGDFHAEIEDVGNISGTRYIWLPRQDQLQKMLRIKDLTCLLEGFHSFCGAGDQGYIYLKEDKYVSQFHSMEQLWLAFVMKELYSKVWNGEAWVRDYTIAVGSEDR